MADFKTIFQTFAKEKELNPDPMQDEAVMMLSDIAHALENPMKKSWFSKSKSTKGLYIWGGVGRGKTMIMDLFCQSINIPKKRRVHFNIFMLDVHNNIQLLRESGQGANPLQQIAQEISQSVRLLCFDEFQIYDIADAMVLSELFRELFRLNVTVVATSNVAPEELYKDGLQRSRFLPFIPLIKNNMAVLNLDSGLDYRQQALRDNGTYFIQAEDHMLKLFNALISPNIPKESMVKVKGRNVPIEKSANNFAWVNFSELCEKPRAAADYQALCNAYQTIFINGVPRMGYDRRNEAKRFILLIDTIYDAGKRLVINAGAEPIKLYNGKDHAFEFERTISRLLEMQGEEYLLRTSQEIIDKL